MERYDFDRVVDRRGTNCLKYDFAVERGRPANALPLWVADMDFPAPPCVNEALRRLVDHGIYGYSEVKDSYFDAVAGWFSRRFGWLPRPEWLVKTPGVVFALAMAVRAFTRPGDGVVIQPPVYYPFREVIEDNGRRVVENRLCLTGGHYEVDFDGFEAAISQEDVRLFILCSPHNPVGRVWSREELARMADICQRHGVIVVSDEIHCDFAFPDHPHTMLAQAAPRWTEGMILCTAASKTFNLAGLQVSNIWIPDPSLKARFCREIAGTGYSQLNIAGLVATEAAYRDGEAWFDACFAYLRDNLACFRDFLETRLPALKLIEPEGTYFAWVDCSGLGLSDAALNNALLNRAGLWLDAGGIFGGGCGQFQRFALAAPRATIEEALARLEKGLGEGR